jgi:type I restriction enzyme M protein
LKDEGRIAEDGVSVIRRIHKPGKVEADPMRGLFPLTIEGKHCVVEYEPNGDLRDTEMVPLKEPGGIEAFIRREVLPHAPDAWIDEAKTSIGYEISFTRYFYKPQPLRPLEAIRADILALERETDGLMADIAGAAR